MSNDTSQPGVAGLGRRILLGLGGLMVLLGGLLGFIVGANGGEELSELTVFGMLTVPISPGAMTLYGMIVIAVAITVLYSAVSLASRFDSNAQ
jgi:ABC-type antimicrobial peptide transport system permease subunit